MVALLVSFVRGVAPTARWFAVTSRIGSQGRQILRRARRRATSGQVRLVEIGLGTKYANRYFWNGPFRVPMWWDTQQRLNRLLRTDPASVEEFVRLGCARTTDPTTLFGLARHPSAADAFRRWLSDEILMTDPSVSTQLRVNRLMSGAMVGAASILLDPEQAARVERFVTDLHQVPKSTLFQIRDSFGTGLVSPGDSSRLGNQCRRRLIIAEQAEDLDMLALLLPGADAATVVTLHDMYGLADLSSYTDWVESNDISVENLRSRITRFSQDYIDLHESTAAAAEQLCARVTTISDLLPADCQPFVDVEVADFLFFKALGVRAVEVLLADCDFDHVVIAVANQKSDSEFLRLLSGIDRLDSDRRVEVVSISRSTASRSNFWAQIEQLQSDHRPQPHVHRLVPAELVRRKCQEDARRVADTMPSFGASARPTVALVTTNNPAYNQSTAYYASVLAQFTSLKILHLGRNATDLSRRLHNAGAGGVGIEFLVPTPERFDSLTNLVLAEIGASPVEVNLEVGSAQSRLAAEAAGASCLQHLVRSTIVPAIARLCSIEAWFDRLAAIHDLPDLIVLTPSRKVGVGGVTMAARRHRVPSLALEPHAHDANYSRYLKITSDYYGVMSDYFRSQAIAGLGADYDRTVVVGSPLQVAPPGYDPATERRQARSRYASMYGLEFPDDVPHLAFFCQPSKWEHVSKIWRHLLDAAVRADAQILLKTHPEEAPARLTEYLTVAAEAGAADRVRVLNCDAPTSLALADIAVTAYSAAAIDAAVRQLPVICLTDGDLRYPVDIHAIVDAPVARSADDLVEMISDFRQGRGEFERRARSLLERESQFVEGPDRRLRELVTEIVDLGEAALRPRDKLPSRLFLDEPHPVFPV